MAQKLLLFIQSLIIYDQKNFVTNSKMNTSKKAVSQCLRKANRGFTIVEIITVVAIFSALALIGYPTFTKWVPNYDLKGATRTLQGNFQKAKLHAVKTNNDVTFSFTVDNTCTGPTSYTFTDEDGVVVAAENFPAGAGVCLTASNFVNGNSGFNSRGLSLSWTAPPALPIPPVQVTLNHSRIPRQYIITQTLGGSIRIN